jgi:enamine deaminase RidA (YjgF/YER057c/UK114 family)
MVRDGVLEVDITAITPRDGLQTATIHRGGSGPGAGETGAVIAGDWVFTAGVGGPRIDSTLWSGSGMRAHVEDIMRNRQRDILEAAGSSLRDVVRAQVFLTNMADDYHGFQEAWKAIFPDDPPATCVIPTSGLGGGARVEINLIALKSGSRTTRHAIHTDNAARPAGHEPQAMRAGDLLFLSTVLAADEHGLAREARQNPDYPYLRFPARAQMEWMLHNVRAICEAAGTSMENVVKRQNYFLDLRDYAVTADLAKAAWPVDPPTSTTIGLDGPMSVPGCVTMMSVIAAVP